MSLSLEYIINLPPEKKVDHYCFNYQALLGQGSFSRVYAGFDEYNGTIVAIKTVNKSLLLDDYLCKALQEEIDIMKKLKHPNLVRFYNLVNTINNAYVITEYCNSGDLSQVLSLKKCLSEPEAILVMSDILKGMKELVKNKIIHRDLKPANIFIHDGIFKIGDFGFAKQLHDRSDRAFNPIVGSPYYMPPQYLQNGTYSIKHDIWSLGVMFYEILYGDTPWPSKDRDNLIKNICTKPLNFSKNFDVSYESKKFISQCLEVNEDRRISWEEIFKSELFYFGKDNSLDKSFEFEIKNEIKLKKKLSNYISGDSSNDIREVDKNILEPNYKKPFIINEENLKILSKNEDSMIPIYYAENSKKETSNTNSDSFEENEKKALEPNEDFLNLNFILNEENPNLFQDFSKNKKFTQNQKKLDLMLSFLEFLDYLGNLIEKALEIKPLISLEKAHFLIVKQSTIVCCFLSEIENKNVLKFGDWMNYKSSKSFLNTIKTIQAINERAFNVFMKLADSPRYQEICKKDFKFSKIYQNNNSNENKEFCLITDYFIVSSIKEVNDLLKVLIKLGKKVLLGKEEDRLVRILSGLIEYHQILTFFLANNENNYGEPSAYLALIKNFDFQQLCDGIREKEIDWTTYLGLKMKVYDINP